MCKTEINRLSNINKRDDKINEINQSKSNLIFTEKNCYDHFQSFSS